MRTIAFAHIDRVVSRSTTQKHRIFMLLLLLLMFCLFRIVCSVLFFRLCIDYRSSNTSKCLCVSVCRQRHSTHTRTCSHEIICDMYREKRANNTHTDRHMNEKKSRYTNCAAVERFCDDPAYLVCTCELWVCQSNEHRECTSTYTQLPATT